MYLLLTKNTAISKFKKLSEGILRGFQEWEDKFKWKGQVNTIKYKERKTYDTVNMIRHNKGKSYDSKHRENVESYFSSNNQCQKRADYKGNNIQNTYLWRTPVNGEKIGTHTNTTVKSTNQQLANQQRTGNVQNVLHGPS